MTGKPRSHGMFSARPTPGPKPLAADQAPGGAFRVKVLTIFPELFPGPLAASLTGKALHERLWTLETLDIRRFARNKHRTVDDTPAGGGPGMVMKPDVVAAAIDAAEADVNRADVNRADVNRADVNRAGTPLADASGDRGRWPVIYLSPRGRPLTQARVRELAAGAGLTLLCGRFEGVDERVLEARGVEELSLGDFVLTGGEIPAMALIDAVVRLRPGVLGNEASTEEESFSRGLLEHPHYTRPQVWEGREIPEILLSGHHARIAEWRRARAEELTRQRRPDLWRAYQATGGDTEQSDAHISAGKAGRKED